MFTATLVKRLPLENMWPASTELKAPTATPEGRQWAGG